MNISYPTCNKIWMIAYLRRVKVLKIFRDAFRLVQMTSPPSPCSVSSGPYSAPNAPGGPTPPAVALPGGTSASIADALGFRPNIITR